MLVTNESGPTHFATLTPIRVVALFEPETPALYAACLVVGYWNDGVMRPSTPALHYSASAEELCEPNN